MSIPDAWTYGGKERRWRGARWVCGLALMAILATSCGLKVSPPAVTMRRQESQRTLEFLLHQGGRLYGLIPGHSGRILVLVKRAGPLAFFGHDHVVSTRWLTGLVRASSPHREALFCLPLANLSVDRPQRRAKAGPAFRGTLSPSLRQATDRHMLQSLDAHDYPDLVVLVRPATGAVQGGWHVVVTLHGVSRSFILPSAHVTMHASRASLAIATRFAIRQSSYGIHPYSILGGLLRVRDRLEIVVHLIARRLRTAETRETLLHTWCRFHPPHLGSRT